MVYVNKDQLTPLPPRASPKQHSSDNKAVDVIDELLSNAARQGASDIHIEPQQDAVHIRQRVDGVLTLVESMPLALAPRLISRIKVMAQLDISERRLPQDGRIEGPKVPGLTDLRVSTVPTQWGEKAVMRLLNHDRTRLELGALGMDTAQQKLFADALSRTQGLILVTGPTGSGKTLTLYSGLEHLNSEQLNISTVEDPIEIHLHGANQIAVNHKIGLSFARVLRAFMRQDPDVIMVGEIRDLDTATAAIRAAQTGHLVLSTLHTNSAGSALSRLHQLGIKLYDLTSTVSLVIAQRLVRRLCSHCKEPVAAPAQYFDCGAAQTIFRARTGGCARCLQGYSGRIAVFEFMPVNQGVVNKLHSAGSDDGIVVLGQGVLNSSLYAEALVKVLAGVTSLAEAQRLAPP